MADMLHLIEYLQTLWRALIESIEQPHIYTSLLVFIITFMVFFMIFAVVGPGNFGPLGIVSGSLAAWFQSWAYGAFTPAGGIFAMLTAIGMAGMGNIFAFLLALIPAMIAAVISWLILR